MVGLGGIAPSPGTPDDGVRFRTTIAFGVRNEPGTLPSRGLPGGASISRSWTRPSRAAAWEYVFWADLDAHRDDPPAAAALDELASVTTIVRVFGTYARATT